jgi:hypothetical protein
VDPYGQTTTLSWIQSSGGTFPPFKLDKVTEPGGRYLQVTWDSTDSHIIEVDAFDGVHSSPIQWVTYHWITLTFNGLPPSADVIDVVNYSDGTSAHYTYGDGKYLGPPICTQPLPRGHWHAPQLLTADDPHYPGPMRQIAYTYNPNTNNQTRIASENHAILANGQLTAGEPVSSTTHVRQIQGREPSRRRAATAPRGHSTTTVSRVAATRIARRLPTPSRASITLNHSMESFLTSPIFSATPRL